MSELDAVVFTHAHADHMHGLDDLRQVVYNIGRRLPVWADGPAPGSAAGRFGYAFVQPAGSSPTRRSSISTPSPATSPSKAPAGRSRCTRSRSNTAPSTPSASGSATSPTSLPDVSEIKPEAWPLLDGLAARDRRAEAQAAPDPRQPRNRASLAIHWRCPRCITNTYVDMDYDDVEAETPPMSLLAYDGMTPGLRCLTAPARTCQLPQAGHARP
ncbi:MAG: MBL fold metallo-hydrolase [Paracoccaceae bacterium]